MVAAAIVLAFALDVAGMQSGLCSIPGIGTMCGEFGLGRMPSRLQRAEWDARPPGDCAWLRAYVAGNAGGAYAEQATRLLQTRRTVGEESWVPEERRVPRFVNAGIKTETSEKRAKSTALLEAQRDADRACSGYGNDPFRLRGATIDSGSLEWRCTTGAAGVRCSATRRSSAR